MKRTHSLCVSAVAGAALVVLGRAPKPEYYASGWVLHALLTDGE